MKLVAYIFVVSVGLGQVAHAKLLRNDYLGVRQMGLGGAFIGLADDASALWYNPAGLAQIKKGLHQNMIDLEAGADNGDSFMRVIGALSGNANNLIRMDTPEFYKLGIKPTWLYPHFALSVYDNLWGFSNLNGLSGLDFTADIVFNNDLGAIIGTALPVGNSLTLGASARLFLRTNIDAYLTIRDLLDQVGANNTIDFSALAGTYLQTLIGVGWALGANVGALWKVPLPPNMPKLTLGATIDDVGCTAFHNYGTFPIPKTIYTTYNLGTHLQFLLGRDKSHQINLLMDLRDASASTPLWQRVHAGAEYRNKRFGLSIGVHQGYYSAGASLDLAPHTKIYFSTFAVELNDVMWTNAHRWYLTEVVIGFNPL